MSGALYFNWEIALIELLQRCGSSIAIALAAAVSELGEETVFVAVFGFIYWCLDKELGIIVGLNITAASVFSAEIKNIFLRPRPYMASDTVRCLKPVAGKADIYDVAAQGYSFPSAHSSGAVAAYTTLPIYRRGSRALLLAGVLLPLLVGISRVYLGMHYPTDVIAGWLLGAATIVLMEVLRRQVSRKWLRYMIIFVISAAGVFYCTSEDYYSCLGLLTGLLLGDLFEERFVGFENTRMPVRMIARMIGGFALFFVLNTALKAPFSTEFLESGTKAAHLVRTCRYTMTVFAMVGLYPWFFDRIAFKK